MGHKCINKEISKKPKNDVTHTVFASIYIYHQLLGAIAARAFARAGGRLAKRGCI